MFAKWSLPLTLGGDIKKHKKREAKRGPLLGGFRGKLKLSKVPEIKRWGFFRKSLTPES